jgi:hypothetical protein
LPLRIAAAVAVVGNVAWNAGYDRVLTSAPTIEQASAHYQNPFTPAGFTFVIWAAIYASFAAFAFWLLATVTGRNNRAVDPLLPAFIGMNVLASVWIALFVEDLLVLSVLAIAAQLALGVWGLVRSRSLVDAGAAPPFAAVPFGLFTAWLCVATLANITIALVAFGVLSSSSAQSAWAIAMLVAAAVAGAFGAQRSGPVFALVVAWAAFGVYRATFDANPAVSTTAILAATLLGLVALSVGVLGTHRGRALQKRARRAAAVATRVDVLRGTKLR